MLIKTKEKSFEKQYLLLKSLQPSHIFVFASINAYFDCRIIIFLIFPILLLFQPLGSNHVARCKIIKKMNVASEFIRKCSEMQTI